MLSVAPSVSPSAWTGALFIAQGIPVTLSYTLISFAAGLAGGVLLAVARNHGAVAKACVNGFVSLMRGTPLILQLSFFYFVIPGTGVRLSLFQAGVLAFSLNSMAYMTEIFRGGIQSLPRGQFDAARSLGIPPFLMWRDILLPQVFTRVFPSLVNEMIALLKESAVISMLGEMDIMRRATTVATQSFDYLPPLLWAGLFYYGLVACTTRVGHWMERKWAHAPGS